jgi:hypothetical protein
MANVIDLQLIGKRRAASKHSDLKVTLLAVGCGIAMLGALLAWETRSGPEYPAMNARLEKAVGSDFRSAGISKWTFSYCQSAHVEGSGGSYDLQWREGEDCGLFDRATWRFQVVLGKDGKYHFYSPDINPARADFDGTAKGTIERAQDMLNDYQQAKAKRAADDASRVRSAASWNAQG